MNPKQSERDEDVMIDKQKWMDEEGELVALGEKELGEGYKITAIKSIATPSIRKDLEDRERDCARDNKSVEEI